MYTALRVGVRDNFKCILNLILYIMSLCLYLVEDLEDSKCFMLWLSSGRGPGGY